MRTSLRSRGFTLLELLVGAAIGAVVLAGISLTFISQAQQYQAHASRRGLQSNARQAMAFMNRHLRKAGYGVNPDRAIIPYDSYDAVSDMQQSGYPDALVVHWRDELFYRQASVDLDQSSIPLTTALNQPLRKGQILLVMCARDPADPSPESKEVTKNPPHVFVTVNEYVPKGSVAIPLDPTPANAAPNSPIRGPGRLFHEQTSPGFTSHPCFTRVPPHVLLIHRAAFYVAMFEDNDLRTPYLMMHQGLDMPTATSVEGDGVIDANDAVPVAEGIEQFQVAYILDTHAKDTDKTPIVLGVNEPMGLDHYGETWEQIDTAPDKLPTGWFFNTAYGQPRPPFTLEQLEDKRLLDHPANIRQVRLTLISRSTIPNPSIKGDNLLKRPDESSFPDGTPLTNGLIPWRHLENLSLEEPNPAFKPVEGHFYRVILREAITPKNMLMSRQFAPLTEGGG